VLLATTVPRDEPPTGCELEVLRLLAAASQTSAPPATWLWRSTRSKSTWPTSWASSRGQPDRGRRAGRQLGLIPWYRP